jgi:hypothetical protein
VAPLLTPLIGDRGGLLRAISAAAAITAAMANRRRVPTRSLELNASTSLRAVRGSQLRSWFGHLQARQYVSTYPENTTRKAVSSAMIRTIMNAVIANPGMVFLPKRCGRRN